MSHEGIRKISVVRGANNAVMGSDMAIAEPIKVCESCGQCRYFYSCKCARMYLIYCPNCVEDAALCSMLRAYGHWSCLKIPAQAAPEEKPVRPPGFPKCKRERLLVERHANPKNWIRKNRAMSDWNLSANALRRLCESGAVAVAHCRFPNRGYTQFTFVSYYRILNKEAVRTEVVAKATKLDKILRRTVIEDRRERRHQIATQNSDLLLRSSFSVVPLDDGCHRIAGHPSLEDYEESVEFDDIWLTGNEDRRLLGAS